MPWGVIDVRECGAAGDDQTDDTEAVLQAIDRLPPSGGVLYFPPGVLVFCKVSRLSSKRQTSLTLAIEVQVSTF